MTSSMTALRVMALIVAAELSAGCDSPCDPFEDVDVSGTDTNPDGVLYPTDRWGMTPRDGDTLGDRIPNFAFQGYPDSVRETGLRTVSMADFYDPEGGRSKVMNLVYAVMWCPHCNAQTSHMADVYPELRQEGAVLLEAMVEGPNRGQEPTLCDMADWIESHGTGFTVVIDAEARRMGQVTTIPSVPYNVLIDTRTMEVLDVTLGMPEDYLGYVRSALAWVDEHPL